MVTPEGIRFKCTGRGGFEPAVREAAAGDKLTSELMEAMLMGRAALWKTAPRTGTRRKAQSEV
ncbi:MAG: hypothetical protein ACREYF_11120 [Gammaproteobacteria bacterium]